MQKLNTMREYQLEIFADYFQFHLYDEKMNPNFEDAWDQFSIDNLFAFTNDGIGIGTVRNMNVPVILKVCDSESKFKENLNQVFQINESDLSIISGKLVVIGCTECFPDAKRIELDNGIYRIRVYYSDLDKLSENGLDGEDCYEIEIWIKDKPEKAKFEKLK